MNCKIHNHKKRMLSIEKLYWYKQEIDLNKKKNNNNMEDKIVKENEEQKK